MPTLDTLPNEILSLISNHLDHPRDVSNLLLSSRKLREFVKPDGWKAFLKGRFGLTGRGLDADAQEAVHGLTTLYRNWERKAFVARWVEPTKVSSFNTWETKQWRVIQVREPVVQTRHLCSVCQSYTKRLNRTRCSFS
jgi:hypothetical protein